MSRLVLLALTVLFLAAGSPGQVVWSLDAGMPFQMNDTYLPSASYPGGGPSPIGPFPLPSAGPAAIAAVPFGGITIDQTTSTVYYCDGVGIFLDSHGQYFPFAPVLAPAPPFPAPPLLTGGPITGMAADPAAGILWLCDAASIGGFTLGPPYAPLVPPVPLPFAAAALSGIDIEPSTGTMWAVDVAGFVYNFAPPPVAAPVGPVPVAVVGGLAGPFTGLAVNRSNGPGAAAPPLCSPQIPGYHINVSDGFMVYDALNPANPPIPVPFATGLGSYGLAFSNDFQITFGNVAGSTVCMTSGLQTLPGAQHPFFNGPGGFNFLMLAGAPPLTTVFFMADLCPLPGGLMAGTTGEILWINPFSPSFVFIPMVTNATGVASLPVGLGLTPAGIQFSYQWGVLDPLHPLGMCLSDMATATIGLP